MVFTVLYNDYLKKCLLSSTGDIYISGTHFASAQAEKSLPDVVVL